MKKTLLTLFTVGLFNFANAQVSAYTFAGSTGSYTAITGGTLLGGPTSDEENFVDPAAVQGTTITTTGVGFPIGFNFTYNGLVFNRLAISNNGWISLGQSSLTPSVDIESADYYVKPLSQVSTATPSFLRNRIGGLAMDLEGQTGSSLRIQTTGTAPNQICVIQWAGYREFLSTGDNYNFQIRLKEGSNEVEIVYGTFTTVATSFAAQVGLSGTTPSDFNLRKTTTNWSATTAGTVNTDECTLTATVKPASGQTFTWSTPAVCTGTPTAGTASGPTGACSGAYFDLVLTGYSPGVSGITFKWQSSSTSGGTYTDIPGGITSTFSTSQTATTYYRCIVTCTGSGATAISVNIVTVTMNAFMDCYCTSTATSALDEEIFNVTVGTLNNSSTCATTGGAGSTLNKYSNYTTVAAPTLSRTAATALSVQVGTCGTGSYKNIVKIFIDYNKNGSFAETGETVYTSDTASGAHIVTGTFTVPAGASSGNTLMRVVCRETSNPSLVDSCGTYSWGETEDYLVNIPSLVGIEENEMLNTISVYPNPTTGLFNITTSNANFTQLTISVIDIQGKEVFNTSDKNYSANYNKQINLEGLAKGIYYIRLTTGTGVKTQKLIIQ